MSSSSDAHDSASSYHGGSDSLKSRPAPAFEDKVAAEDDTSYQPDQDFCIRKAFRAFMSSRELEEKLAQLNIDEVEKLASRVVATMCSRKQEEHLIAFKQDFIAKVDPSLQTTHSPLLQSFLKMVAGMQLQTSEQPLESYSSAEGTVNVSMPGLPDGVSVSRSRTYILVHDGKTLLERNEVRVKLGGLDVYSGYWLAADSPASSTDDLLHEEGTDTLQRVMEAAGIDFSGGIYEEALQYPFLSAVLAPLGPEAIHAFEEHLRQLHKACSHKRGGCWYNMKAKTVAHSSIGLGCGVLESGTSSGTADGEGYARVLPRSRLTPAEEADLELSKLDL